MASDDPVPVLGSTETLVPNGGRAYDGSTIRWGVKPVKGHGWQWWTYGPRSGSTSTALTRPLAVERAKKRLREEGVRV